MSSDWYKNAVVYAVDVAAFQDSNGDGIGDFPGLVNRLDYLADLGVTLLWLLPFYPSPRRDNGYDVTNYYGVHPALGTLEQFMDCVHQAGARGIRILLDLVVHHTSNEHPWFQAARHSATSRFRPYYIWAESPPPVPPGQGNVFPDAESTVWTYDTLADAYYYHRFYHFEPALNVVNPEVREEIARILDFWLSFGVAGFRVDAASHLIEPKGDARPDNAHDILKALRRTVSTHDHEAILVGEADEPIEALGAYFGDKDELHLLFNFLLNNYLYLGLAQQRADPIARAVRLLAQASHHGEWINFLRNLDELDLERLTEAERQEVYAAFAPDPAMRIYNRGIRRRLAPMLGDRRRLEMALSVLFSLPGVPMLVYGDEIGLGEDLSLEGREAVRLPMQWSRERQAGFSTAPTSRLVRPLCRRGPFGFPRLNVAQQLADDGSLLNWVKRLIAARRDCPEWGWGDGVIVETGEPSVLAHRTSDHGGALLAVHNLADKPSRVELPGDWAGVEGRAIVGRAGHGQIERLDVLELEPYGYRWYRVSHAHH